MDRAKWLRMAGFLCVSSALAVSSAFSQTPAAPPSQGTVQGSAGSGPAPVAPPPPAPTRPAQDFEGLNRYRAANAALPPTAPGRVIFFGDSITDAWAAPRNASVFFPGKNYIGRGISGQTTPQMILRFREDVINLHPEAVLILAATNDVAGNTGPMTPEMTEENFETMAELGKLHGIRVILCSILPASDFGWRKGLEPAPKIRALNAWLKTYAAQQGLQYVDYYSALANDAGGMKDGTSSDGVHPTQAGYAIMEPLAQAAIDNKP